MFTCYLAKQIQHDLKKNGLCGRPKAGGENHCEAWQISAVGEKDFINDRGIWAVPVRVFLQTLI